MLSNSDKNLLIASCERAIAEAKVSANVATLAEIETTVQGLRTAYASDPDTVLASSLVAAVTTVTNLRVPTLTDIRAVITRAQTSAAAEE